MKAPIYVQKRHLGERGSLNRVRDTMSLNV